MSRNPEPEPAPEPWKSEIREFAREFMNELREMARGANAEAKTRGEQYMEKYVGDPPRPQTATEVWSRFGSEPTVFVRADYELLRTGLGRGQQDGTTINTPLVVERDDRVLVVSGRGLARSIGLVVRLSHMDENGSAVTSEEVVPRESFGEHRNGCDPSEGKVRIPFDVPQTDALVTVVSFDAASITGTGVLQISPSAAAKNE